MRYREIYCRILSKYGFKSEWRISVSRIFLRKLFWEKKFITNTKAAKYVQSRKPQCFDASSQPSSFDNWQQPAELLQRKTFLKSSSKTRNLPQTLKQLNNLEDCKIRLPLPLKIVAARIPVECFTLRLHKLVVLTTDNNQQSCYKETLF